MDLLESGLWLIQICCVNVGFFCFEYRGYDLVGFVVDGDKKKEVFVFKEVGKVVKLRQFVDESKFDFFKVFDFYVGIVYICWVIYGFFFCFNCYFYRYVYCNFFILI